MKKLAARDFEDLLQVSVSRACEIIDLRCANMLLQCAIPVFDGLLPEPHNSIVLDLLFCLATWHAYAKLRLHTSTTIKYLKVATTELGQILRHFSRTTCETYVTHDLPHEEAARGRRKAAKAAKAAQTATGPSREESNAKGKKKSQKRQRHFNLSTYKLHALGDYANTIAEFGTTDNYTTQVVRAHAPFSCSTTNIYQGELEHRRVKRLYARTNKFNYVPQITIHERRERLARKGQDRARADKLPYTNPEAHYHISSSEKAFINVPVLLSEKNSALQVCKCFLLRRLCSAF
jgi:hypothetical protein